LLIWLAYQGGDALAIYALATLFNRQRKAQHQPLNCSCGDVNESRDLEVLWAPILLMHLGGQINISAYNIEDNELWCRRILTAVAQVRKKKKENSLILSYFAKLQLIIGCTLQLKRDPDAALIQLGETP
jgi:hypothetical protein